MSFTAALFLALLSSDDFCSQHLDRVAALHREFGLPLPPREAKLVECKESGKLFLAFTVDGVTLWPDRRWKLTSIKPVKPDVERLRGIDSVDWLVLAVVAHERGWKPLARVAMRKWAAWLQQFHWCDAEQDLGYTALDYWETQIYASPDIPLRFIAKYLRRMQKYSLEGAKSQKLLQSVELALKPRNSHPGSDDALIDALIDAHGEPKEDDDNWTPAFRNDPRYRAIVRRGLDAVPALIAHLDDDRITRARGVVCGDNHRRVREIALDILTQLHGGHFEIEQENLNELLKAIGIWFADANKLGEEKYILSRILGADPNSNNFHNTLFWLLTDKYPRHLPDLFRKVIDTQPGQRCYAERYAKAIAETPLTIVEKRKILEYAASHEHPSVRAAGIRYLRLINPKLAKELLLQTLREMSTDSIRSQCRYTAIAAESDDPDVWKTLALELRRADVRTRINLLDEVASIRTPEGRKQRLSMLAEYLTDDTELGGHGDPRFLRLEVRNFVALELAELFPINTEGTRAWTAEKWAELRAKVQVRVKQELNR